VDVISDTGPRRGLSLLRMLLLLLIAVVAMGNGLYFSPYFDKLLILTPRLASAFFIKGQEAIFYLTGFALWMMTLMIAGLPAALWDRVRGLPQGSILSLAIWLLAACVITYDSWLVLYELFFDP
jgi:hypothetical protein